MFLAVKAVWLAASSSLWLNFHSTVDCNQGFVRRINIYPHNCLLRIFYHRNRNETRFLLLLLYSLSLLFLHFGVPFMVWLLIPLQLYNFQILLPLCLFFQVFHLLESSFKFPGSRLFTIVFLSVCFFWVPFKNFLTISMFWIFSLCSFLLVS